MQFSLKKLACFSVVSPSFLRLGCVLVLSASLVGVAQALPAEMELDRFMLAAQHNLERNRIEKVDQYLQRIKQLDVDLPSLYYYYQAAVYQHHKQPLKQRKALETYVESAGKKARYYTQALISITQLEEARQSADHQPVQLAVSKRSVQSASTRLSSVSKGAASVRTQSVVKTPEVDQQQHQAYVKQLKSLYLTDSYVTALIRHINDMLTTHVYTGKRLQDANKLDVGIAYRVSLGKDATLITTMKDNTLTPETILSDSLSVFGKNAFIKYSCDYEVFRCVIKKPDNHSSWLQTSYAPKMASDLTKALSQLVQSIQRGAK